MPIYEYRCQSCGEDVEALQKVSEPALTDCPSCGESALKKLVSAAGFQLKGTGWYVTDFRDKGKKPDQKSGDTEKAETKSDEKSDAKSESKPETKKEQATAKKGSDGASASAG